MSIPFLSCFGGVGSFFGWKKRRLLSNSPFAAGRDEKGLAAVEFSLLAPLLVSALLGCVEFCQAYTAERRLQYFASTVGDLVAQIDADTECDSATIDGIVSVGNIVMSPFNYDDVELTISSIEADGDNDITVGWSKAYNGATALTAGSGASLPEGLTQPFGSVIVAEATYEYNSIVAYYVTGPVTLTSTIYLKPRKLPRVVCD